MQGKCITPLLVSLIKYIWGTTPVVLRNTPGSALTINTCYAARVYMNVGNQTWDNCMQGNCPTLYSIEGIV